MIFFKEIRPSKVGLVPIQRDVCGSNFGILDSKGDQLLHETSSLDLDNLDKGSDMACKEVGKQNKCMGKSKNNCRCKKS